MSALANRRHVLSCKMVILRLYEVLVLQNVKFFTFELCILGLWERTDPVGCCQSEAARRRAASGGGPAATQCGAMAVSLPYTL